VLVRMRDHNGELVAPDAFLPTAERFNMMVEIDKWVIRQAFRAYAEQMLMGRTVELAINLSGQSVCTAAMIDYIGERLLEYRVEPTHITFEITETKAVSHIAAAQALIGALRELGCRFALDDFGAGFCSFGHLKHLEVDYLKIDGSFSQGVLNDSIDRAVITAINDIAHRLGKQTVAEYVDSPAVLRALRECGCDHFQGYFIARPQQMMQVSMRAASVVA
jgi:EAL domain-containing protein (putative c-di-GMP-specific phosphodiesterase class I)